MSPNFTVSSGEIAVGNPLGEYQRYPLSPRNPGTYRLAPQALLRIDDAGDEGISLNDGLVFAWDAVFTDALAKALGQHRENCSGDFKVMEKRSWQLKSLAGTKVGCYPVRYACDKAPPGRYQLQPSNVVRSSDWRFGIREAAGRLSIGAIVWSFSLGFLAAGFLCLLGVLFAIAAIGCTVHHFVDPGAMWDSDPIRGIIEPLTWAGMSALAISAGICLYHRSYFWAMGMIILIGVIGTAGTSWYGF